THDRAAQRTRGLAAASRSYGCPWQVGRPSAARVRDLAQDIAVRSARALEDVEAVIGAFQPAHGPSREAADSLFHQVAPAQRIAGTVQAENGHRDLREMRVAQFLRLTRRMQRVGEKQAA